MYVKNTAANICRVVDCFKKKKKKRKFYLPWTKQESFKGQSMLSAPICSFNLASSISSSHLTVEIK